MKIFSLALLTTLSSIPFYGQIAAASSPAEPDTQKQFCSLVAEYMKNQTAYSHETNPIRKAALRPPNPQADESAVKEIFGSNNHIVDWIGVVQFSVNQNSVSIRFSPDCDGATQHNIQFANNVAMRGMPIENQKTVVPLSSPLAKSLATAPSSNIRASVTAQVVPFSGLTKLNNILAANHTLNTSPQDYKSSAGNMGASVANPNYLTKFQSVTVLGDANKK